MKTNLLFSQASELGKRLAMLLTLLLTVGIGQVWGATDIILWNGSNPSYAATTTEKTSTDGAIKWKNSAVNNYSNPTRIYSGNTLTISVANTTTTKITKIVAVCSSNDYASAFGGTSVTVTGGGSATRSVNSTTTTITISGTATAVAIKMSAQSRVSKLTVTYETASSDPYTVTLYAGPGTCAVSVTEISAGAGVTLPTPTLDGCGNWEFAGWKETSAVSTETTTAPTLWSAGSIYKPTNNCALYAVYQRIETTQGGGSSEETVDFSSQGYTNQQEVSSYYGTNFSVAFDKGSNSNTPKYYTSGTAIRIYGGGYFTISSESTITKIVITFGSSDGSNAITAITGTYTSGTWTGSANSVKFTIGGSSGNRRIKSLAVTTTGGSSSTTYYHSTPDCGTSTPTPTLNVDPATLTFENTTTNTSTEKTFTLTGSDLTANALLQLSVINSGMFSVNPTSVTPKSDGTIDQTITVTYTPTATGNHNATLTISSTGAESKTVTLFGTGVAQTANYTVKHYQQNLDGTYPTIPTNTENLSGEVGASVTPAVKSYEGFTAPSTKTVTIAADGSTVVEYQYTRNSYTLIWNLDGGTIITQGTAAGEVKYGATLTAPTVTKTGYTFAGWSPEVAATMPANPLTYTAQWAKVYTITWMVGGNEYTTGSPTTSVESNQKISSIPDAPDDNTLADCGATKFMGWSTDNIGSTPDVDAPTDLFTTVAEAQRKIGNITENKTFYAVFATEEPSNTTTTSSTTISGDNSGTIANVLSWYSSKNDGTAITAWNDNHFRLYPNKSNGNGSSITITPVSGVTISEVVLTATSTTYAKPVKYNIDGGSDISGTWSNTTMTISDINATSSFKFRNAHTGANNDQLRVNIEVTYSKLETTTTYSNYVTQCCTDWTPTLTYSKTTLDASTNETATPTIKGNTHSAPVSFESSNRSVLTVDANNGTITAVGAGKATITATWDATGVYCGKSITTDEITVNGNFLVTFYANDGSENTTTQQIPSNTATALNANTFQRDGYTFQGWARSDSGAKEYDDGQEVTLSRSGLDLYAVWKINAYQITIGTITGNGTITTSPASSANYEAQVTITATPAAHYTLTSVVVTRDDNSQTVADGGNKFTMPASDVTITAVFTENEKFAINYAIPTGGGEVADDAPTWIYSDGSITLPDLKDGTIAPEYSCEELIGWTTLSTYENANGQKPNPFYAIGASLSGITQNTTLYAVYSRPGEGASGTVELTCTDVSTWKSDVLSGNTNSYGTVTTRSAADGSEWKTNGLIQNAGGISLKENYYIQIPTLPGPATSITMKVSQGNIGSGEDACTDNVASATSRAFYFRSADNGSNLFTSETTSSRSRTINITEGNYTTGYIINGEGTSHIHSVTVAYGSPNIISTSLNCSNDIDEFTITYNLNQSSVVSGTQITGVCESGVMYKFSEITEYTICSAPRANGYQLVGWNTQANGKGGLTYTPGQVITSVPLSTLTLYAQWAPVVSLSDVGNISTVNATTVGGSVTLPDGENGCDPYEFIGWTEVYPSWNETAQLPTLVANPYTPTAPITLYAVYTQRTTAGAFTDNGAGGVYEIWVNNSAKNHMAGQRNDSYNLYTKEYWDSYKTGSNGAPFIITKIAENTYTIQNAEGHYIAKHSNDTKLDIESEWQNLDRYKWTVSAGTNGSWRFTNKAATTHALIYYNPYFRLYSASSVTNGSSYYDLELTPVESAVYYSAPTCGDYAIHFYTHGGEFVQGYYAFSTAVTEGLNGTVETKFPSATLNGYTFVGWKENAPQDELTDNSPEGDTSAEPYGLKKPGDDLITTTRREFHAVYYYYDELQDIDFSAPFTTGMYAEVNGTKYFLSGTPDRGTMSSTTDCGYVSEVTITPGTGANAGKYKITVNDVGMAPEAEETDLVAGTAWWTITETSAGSGEYKISGADERNIMLLNSSFGHYSYNVGSSYGAGYYYPKFGNCREHHWASDPKRKPSIILSSSGPLTITSAAGQTIKSINKLFVGATHYETQTKIYLTCDVDGVGLLHEDGTALSSDANGEYLTTTAEGELASTNLILTYSPTITTDGIETVTITAQDAGNQATANRLAEVRHLPATFAIVAKVGNLWYALPSQGLNSTDALVGYPVEVDNQNDPTAVTAVPENADWSLRQVYAASHSDAQKDRFKLNGANIMFENNASPAKMLNASSSDNYLLTNAEYDNYKQSDNQGLYEWTPTTTDLETYQLTNEQRGRTLSVNIATVFGVHAQNVATNNLRFLPITGRYTPAALQVVEWKENSVVIMYNGDPAQTASVSVNGGEAQTTTLSAAQRDIAVYELKATGLAANPTQRLSITIGTEKLLLPIPYIVNSNTTDATLTSNNKMLAAVSDLVVLNGKTFTADAATASKYTFRNVTIYGGGKLVIPSEKGFGVASLTLRAGGITDAGKYDYVYPQFELRGTFTNSAAKINYDYITDYDHWYHLVLPFSGDLGTIKYPTEFYGANVAANNTGSWQIKRYAGEIRATGNYNAWVDIETEGETSTTAGQGYIFWGAPKKVSVNGGASTRQKWGIQRITMSVKASDAETEKADKILTGLSSYANVPNNSGKDNDQGWNLVGNPYMVNLTNMATTGLHACKLVEVIDPATGKWNGKWKWNNETNIRYLTIPSEHFDTYTAKTVAQSVPLVAGRAFFVQLEGEADGITFAAANRASLMPALLAENNDKPVDIETGIILSNETLQDEVNFWIKDGKTNNYEYNADYPKTPNNNHFNIYGVHTNGDLSWVATSPEYAAQSMPIGYQVPAAGTFTLSVSETYYSENLQALFVTDHEASPEVTTNLVDEDYTFYVNQAETNNTRFTVSIILKPDTENTPTGVDNINTKANQPIKFLYQDKIYILRNGIIYDTTGKQVITINK